MARAGEGWGAWLLEVEGVQAHREAGGAGVLGPGGSDHHGVRTADHAGLGSVFGASMLAAFGAAGVAAILLNKSAAPSGSAALACAQK